MILYLPQDQKEQGNFQIFWWPGKGNLKYFHKNTYHLPSM